jgi:RNA polymerase sigma-70 factor (family 1)
MMMMCFSDLSDSELVKLLQSGSSAAFEEIYGRYSAILLNHAYNKTRNREEAKDIVHEVFAALWKNHKDINPDSNLPGYLYTCVRNIFLNQVARGHAQSKYLESIREFSMYDQVIADYQVRERQLLAIINAEIANLPSKMGEVFKLSRNEYLTHKQIAERLSISEQTVSKHITNALKILRVKLGIVVYIFWLIHNK